MPHFRFDVVFNEDLERRASDSFVHAACCKDWRSVRAMLRYYGRDSVTVFKVRWQPYHNWKHDKRKPTHREVAAYLTLHP